MTIYNNEKYIQDIRNVTRLEYPWHILNGSSIMITGGTGLIGSFFVDVLMEKNSEGLNCDLFILTRDIQKSSDRFSKWRNNPRLHFVEHNVNEQLVTNKTIQYIFYLASNTHPKQYATDPISTITTNIIGLNNLLELAVNHKVKRFVYASSNEIYGENRNDAELFSERYCGYIDSNTLRAGYPESKRCGEALCQAYMAQKKLNVVIPRFTRTYGPTMRLDDSKAISQFIIKAVNDQDIVLKSPGEQYYSYTYVADAVSGLLTVFFDGQSGEAYNISDLRSDIRLKDLANMIATYVGRKVVFEVPDDIEKKGYSLASVCRLDSRKLQSLGWNTAYTIEDGVVRTIDILKNTACN